MANICDYDIHIFGEDKEAVVSAAKELMQCSPARYEGGPVMELKSGFDDYTAEVSGCCPWSACSSDLDYDLMKICEKYKVSADLVTEEGGMQFSEHIVYEYDEDEDEVIEQLNETNDFEEFCLEDLMVDRESFEWHTDIELSDEEWERLSKDWNLLKDYGFTDHEGGYDFVGTDYIHRGQGICETERWY